MPNKIKFRPAKEVYLCNCSDWYFDDYITNGRFKIYNPLPEYDNLPDGEYYIRLDFKGEYNRIRSIKKNGIWYSVYVNYPESFYIKRFKLFPQLSESEYRDMGKVYDKLSKRWQMNYDAFIESINHIKSRRRVNKMMKPEII